MNVCPKYLLNFLSVLLPWMSEVDDCVPNSHWWPLAMHPVLTLGKRREIAALEWERVPGWSGRPHICPCVLKSPHGLSSDPPPLLDFTIQLSKTRRTFQPRLDLLPVSSGTIAAHLLKRSDLHQHAVRLLSDNTELLFNMSSEPQLLLLSGPLCGSAQHMIRWTPVCFVTTSHLLPIRRTSILPQGQDSFIKISSMWQEIDKPKEDNFKNRVRLAVPLFLRRGAFSLMLLFQLLSHCQPCPHLLLILHTPMSGFLHPPSHPSTHLQLVAWCLDTSGWFVAPVIHGAISSCHNCPVWHLTLKLCRMTPWSSCQHMISFVHTEHCILIFIQNKCRKTIVQHPPH